jgi:uncharacterized coiled-coil protein SlyX
MSSIPKVSPVLSTAVLTIVLLTAFAVQGQTTSNVRPMAATTAVDNILKTDSPAPPDAVTTEAARLTALEEALRVQSAQLRQLQSMIEEQQETIKLLAARLAGTSESTQAPAAIQATATARGIPESGSKSLSSESQTPPVEDRLKKVEGRVAELGNIKFSGDIRLRSESIFGQSNNLANGGNPAILGNELSARHRMRMRARLAMRGSINDEFDWGLRLATGSFADNISTNQTLTDFFNRKPFALDQAFVTYKPHRLPGLRLQGGKFEPPWTFTEMTIDNDLMVEGFNESYTRTSKDSTVKELTFVAWQLPLLERNSAFVRNNNGTVNIDESRRGGRDLALYGGQVRTRLEPNPKVALSLSVADLYFSGTQFISPIQVFGNQLLLPVTFIIPASGTTPAQTITTQVAISRDLLVAGNGSLGLTNASNNATNRDGRLASGYNLVDVLTRLELKHNKRFPVTLLFDFVTNTQTHDVVTAGLGGADLLVSNKEKHGYWGEVQVGSTRARGDMQFGYTFLRIQKDAVLTPFNFSDVTQQSDMRAHRLQFSYAADPRVTFTVTGIVTERPHGLLGPFVVTPPGSLNRPTTRLQFDTVIRF